MRVKVDALLRQIEARGGALSTSVSVSDSRRLPKTHVIAYSGGVDSSLAAKLVHQVFPDTTAACLGISPSLSEQQLEQARDVARQLRVPLWECRTTESENAQYIENRGQRCDATLDDMAPAAIRRSLCRYVSFVCAAAATTARRTCTARSMLLRRSPCALRPTAAGATVRRLHKMIHSHPHVLDDGQ